MGKYTVSNSICNKKTATMNDNFGISQGGLDFVVG